MRKTLQQLCCNWRVPPRPWWGSSVAWLGWVDICNRSQRGKPKKACWTFCNQLPPCTFLIVLSCSAEQLKSNCTFLPNEVSITVGESWHIIYDRWKKGLVTTCSTCLLHSSHANSCSDDKCIAERTGLSKVDSVSLCGVMVNSTYHPSIPCLVTHTQAHAHTHTQWHRTAAVFSKRLLNGIRHNICHRHSKSFCHDLHWPPPPRDKPSKSALTKTVQKHGCRQPRGGAPAKEVHVNFPVISLDQDY